MLAGSCEPFNETFESARSDVASASVEATAALLGLSAAATITTDYDFILKKTASDS